jgi:UPF0716 family protein affecting phage T7 exclusion
VNGQDLVPWLKGLGYGLVGLIALGYLLLIPPFRRAVLRFLREMYEYSIGGEENRDDDSRSDHDRHRA